MHFQRERKLRLTISEDVPHNRGGGVQPAALSFLISHHPRKVNLAAPKKKACGNSLRLLTSTPTPALHLAKLQNEGVAVASYFAQAHAFTAQWEGGLTDHPNDKGGITKYGVSLAFLSDLAQTQAGRDVLDRMGIRLPVTRETIRALTPDHAASLFKWQFWDRLRCDDLQPRTALIIYDAAVNHGPARSVKLVQQACNIISTRDKLVVDGALGPLTRSALKANNTPTMHAQAIEQRRRFYRNIVDNNPSQAVFLRGWLNRADALEQYLPSLPLEAE